MNESPNDVSSNDPVFARLRSALDEVAAVAPARPLTTAPHQRGMGLGRVLAIAAAAILVVGGVAAVAINRNNSPAASPSDTTPPTPTEPTLIRSEVPWYTLASPEMVPGAISTLPNPLAENPVGFETSMAWARNGDPADALFLLRSGPGSPDMAPADTSLVGYQMIGDQAVAVWSYGLSAQEQANLLEQVQPGSGLPWVLAAEGWVYLGLGTAVDGSAIAQSYSGTAGGAVTISVGPLFNQFLTLATVGSIEPVTVAGQDGWKATTADGVFVLWPAADSGYWATMTIDASLADRTDGLIAAVAEVEVDPTQPTVETVLAPPETVLASPNDTPATPVVVAGGVLPMFTDNATDPAIGLPAPAVVGHDFDGNEVSINPMDGAHLVIFVAHWCPHCNAELPMLVQAAADGTLPAWLQVTLVSTAESASAANYPPQPWLAEQGWIGRVIQDGNEGDGAAGTIAQAYGAAGWPYFVLIGGDGKVAARVIGEITPQDLQSLIATFPRPR